MGVWFFKGFNRLMACLARQHDLLKSEKSGGKKKKLKNPVGYPSGIPLLL